MNIEFAEPAPHLKSLLSLYYRVRSDAPVFEEIDRADIGVVRFRLKGDGYLQFHDGSKSAKGMKNLLIGPGTAAANIRLEGPIDVVGCSLLPLAWGGAIIDDDSSKYVDCASNALAVLGPKADNLPELLAATNSIEETKKGLDTAFSKMVQPLSKRTVAGVEELRQWLAGSPSPDVQALTQGDLARSRRFSRIGNRHFGGPPKMLARKVRALRAAQAITLNDGNICDEALDPFYDQPHMVREIKHFTGRSPGKLVTPEEMLLQMVLDRPYFRELEPDLDDVAEPPKGISS
jgi:hypothetical protein